MTQWRAAAARMRDLDWLGLFLASWVAPLAYDDWVGLTYFSSLLFWLVPTLLLLPRFLHYTDPGGRRRSAFRLAVLQIVALGIVLDFVFGHLILLFSTAIPDPYLFRVAGIPIEEVLFYAMAPVATLLVYAWCDEYWVSEYNPVSERLTAGLRQPLSLSTRAFILGVVLEGLGLYVKHRCDPDGPLVPAYYTFLVIGAFVPAWVLFRSIGRLVNWRAFGITTLYVIITSLVWEATLALPRGWWGYQQRAMIGCPIGAWSSPTVKFPIEAAAVWLCAPFSIILVYEAMNRRQYRLQPTKLPFAPPS